MTFLIAASPVSTAGGFTAAEAGVIIAALLGLTAVSWGLFIWHDRRETRREQQREGGRHA